jgi:hypothetical protein
MKKLYSILAVLALLTFGAESFGAVRAFNHLNTNLGIQRDLKCTDGVSCSVVNGKLVFAINGPLSLEDGIAGAGELVGFRSNQETAAANVTPSVSQCGSTFINSGAVELELPSAATVGLGCRITLVTMNPANFDADPNGTDLILGLTNAAGDKIRNATLGNSVTIETVSPSAWAPVDVYGTWSDAN